MSSITVTCLAKVPAASEPEVDLDLKEFEAHLVESNMGPELDRHERAIIKTYLHWKLWGAKDKAARPKPDDPGQQGFQF